jgi:hypothetical protein
MKTILLAILLVACVPPAKAETTSKLGYGSRVGMEVTVLSASGLDTEHAVIITRHTREDASRFCVEYDGRVTSQCIADELAVPLNDRVLANCRTGEFVDFFGHHYLFEGPLPRSGDPLQDMAKYGLRDMITQELADGTSASGYPVNIGIFRALCPSRVPPDK